MEFVSPPPEVISSSSEDDDDGFDYNIKMTHGDPIELTVLNDGLLHLETVLLSKFEELEKKMDILMESHCSRFSTTVSPSKSTPSRSLSFPSLATSPHPVAPRAPCFELKYPYCPTEPRFTSPYHDHPIEPTFTSQYHHRTMEPSPFEPFYSPQRRMSDTCLYDRPSYTKKQLDNVPSKRQLFEEVGSTPTHTVNPISELGLSPNLVDLMKRDAASRKNFAANLVKAVFPHADKDGYNCTGTKGKKQLNVQRLSLVRKLVYKKFPLKPGEEEEKDWKRACVKAIDEKLRRKIKS